MRPRGTHPDTRAKESFMSELKKKTKKLVTTESDYIVIANKM